MVVASRKNRNPGSDSHTLREEKLMSQQQRTNPAEIYEQYFVPGIFARWTPVLLKYAALRPDERVLDVACGTGIAAQNVAPLVGAEGTVVGIDISPDMLSVARALPAPVGAAIEWRQADAVSLPLPSCAFDLVLCQQGLQFLPDRTSALRDIYRVLAPGGRVVLSVWQGLEHQPVYAALCEAEARYLNTSIDAVAGPAFSLGSAGKLRTLLEEAGFEQVETMPESLTVRFPEPERFVMLTSLAAAAVIPEFSDMDKASRSALVETVGREVDGTLQEYIEGDTIAFPMHAYMAVAYA